MLIQPRLLVEQTDHSTGQTQLTAAPAARGHPTQQGAGVLLPSQQQPCCQTRNNQQRDGNQGKQARPRGDLLHAGLGQAQPPFRIATASLAAGPVGILCHGLRCRLGPIGHQIPEASFALGIPFPAHRHPQWVRGARAASAPAHAGKAHPFVV